MGQGQGAVRGAKGAPDREAGREKRLHRTEAGRWSMLGTCNFICRSARRGGENVAPSRRLSCRAVQIVGCPKQAVQGAIYGAVPGAGYGTSYRATELQVVVFGAVKEAG
eukprot:317296-Chlamydomonas_euryale.AAC.1